MMQQAASTHPRPPTTTPAASRFSVLVITPAELHPPATRQFDAEVRAVRALFSDAKLGRLHLRKPGADPAHVAAYLSALEPGHRRRVVVHGAAVRGTALAAAVAPFCARGELGGVHYREADRSESARGGHAFWSGEKGGAGGGGEGGRRLLRSSGYHSLAAAVGREAAAAAGAAVGRGGPARDGDNDGGGDGGAQEEEPWPAPAYLDYCFLSPVYDSISKAGYRSAGFLQMRSSPLSSAAAAAPPSERGDADRRTRRRAEEPDGRDGEDDEPPAPLRRALALAPLPVLALGGVGPGRLAELRAAGFAGAAVLGAVWGRAEGPVEAYRGLVAEAEAAAG